MLLIRKIGISFTNDVLLVDPNAWYTVRLERRIPITPDVRLLRFSFRSRYQTLGISVGQHLLLCARIDGCSVTRPYTPVSHCDHAGGFDIMVKVYRTGISGQFPEGGQMSQFLDTVRLGTKLKVRL
nr:NADH-cytochrome b5 reductase 1-like [Dermacentor andersoni]